MKILLTKSIVALLLLLPCLILQAQTYSKITYIHSDADGTPFAATDEQGNLAWQLDHYPYGDEYRNTSDERANDTSFAGKAYDSEIGLSYFGSRWYDPAIGRFASIDPRPITPEDYRTFNRYAYGFNNLYKYVDPDGRFAFLIPVVIWAGKTLTITGAGLSGYAVGSNGYDLYSGRKSAGEAARDAAIDVGIALTLKGAGGGLLKAGERFGESIGNATKGIKPSTGPLKNTSGSLDDAANAARNQRGSNPLTQHARQRMATRNVSNDRVQEAIDKGALSSPRGSAVSRTVSASDSTSGRGLSVVQDVKTNRVITVIDKGSGGK